MNRTDKGFAQCEQCVSVASELPVDSEAGSPETPEAAEATLLSLLSQRGVTGMSLWEWMFGRCPDGEASPPEAHDTSEKRVYGEWGVHFSLFSNECSPIGTMYVPELGIFDLRLGLQRLFITWPVQYAADREAA